MPDSPDTDDTIDWKSVTIPRAVRLAARRWPGQSAVEDGDVRLDFEALAAAGLRATRAFMAAGIEHGDRVAIWAPNLHEWIVAAIGLQSAGAVLVPLNTRFKPPEAAYVLRKSRARILCTVGDFLGTNYAEAIRGEELPDLEQVVTLQGDARSGATPFERFLEEGEVVPEDRALARLESVEPDDLCDILFTSGTTGKPKGVMTAHGQTLRVFDTWSRGVSLGAGDRYLIVNPFFHSFGYKAGWLSCLIRGATAIPHLVFDVPQVLARVASERISVLPGPPTLYQSILAHPKRGEFDLSSLRLAVTGARPSPSSWCTACKSELGFETVITAYGLTESCGHRVACAARRRRRDDLDDLGPRDPRHRGPLRGCRGQGGAARRAGRGAGARLQRDAGLLRGPRGDGAQTIDADGWLHTGDVAVMDERGYLRITDRIKDMFISGGFNVYPAEIENLLFGHAAGRPGRRDRRARRAHGRGRHGLRRARARASIDPDERHRLVPRAHGQLQGAAQARGGRRAAHQRLGQGAEVRAAGAGADAVSRASPGLWELIARARGPRPMRALPSTHSTATSASAAIATPPCRWPAPSRPWGWARARASPGSCPPAWRRWCWSAPSRDSAPAQNPILPMLREREVGFILRQLAPELLIVPGVWRGFDYAAMAHELTRRERGRAC